MPPVANLTSTNETSSPCTIALVEQLISQQNNACNCSTTAKNISLGKSELEALLYIVVTLLFYSLGIIVGIITYLKREKKEIEEDKIFDAFVTDYIEPETRSRFDKVQQVIARLQYLKEQKEKKTRMGSEEKNTKNITKELGKNQSENCAEKECIEFVKTDVSKELETMQETNVDSLCEDGERLSSIVAKLIDPEKRQSRENVFPDDDDESDLAEDGEGGITKTLSMQSIKDYTEEPGRSGRSSLACDDDDDDDDDINNENNESSALLTEGNVTDNVEKNVDEAKSPHKPLNRGCIVTNV